MVAARQNKQFLSICHQQNLAVVFLNINLISVFLLIIGILHYFENFKNIVHAKKKNRECF